MEHIKQSMQRIASNISKAKFYNNNKDIFLRHFDGLEQYQALIQAGNFKKMEEIIRGSSEFRLEEFIDRVKGDDFKNKTETMKFINYWEDKENINIRLGGRVK